MEDIVNIKKGKKQEKSKKINRKKLIIAISIGVILLVIGITMLIYYSSKDARKFLDQYLFRKNITEEKLQTIDLNFDSNIDVFAYNKNICIVAENKIMQYNSSGKKEKEINLEINNPIYSVNNKYIAISEKDGSKLSLISGSEILWTKDVDGKISKINLNNNGFVSIIVTGTTHKSVIITFDVDGNELFKTYRSTTNVVDTSISNDNKNLAFAEINTSGTTIQSSIKVVSIQKAKETPAESIINTFDADSNKMIIDIEYSGNDKIVCMYDNSITILENENNTTLLELSEKGKNINFANINLDKNVYRATEENEGIFNTNTVIEIKNVDNNKVIVYTVEGAVKYIYSNNNIIAVSLGSQIEFINTSGWLIKSYKSNQEVQNVVIGNGLAGIVYQDRVELINL